MSRVADIFFSDLDRYEEKEKSVEYNPHDMCGRTSASPCGLSLVSRRPQLEGENMSRPRSRNHKTAASRFQSIIRLIFYIKQMRYSTILKKHRGRNNLSGNEAH